MQEDRGPGLTLFNFEEPFAENSKYVLTSPRSLRACQIVGIKPVELLTKPLSEFETEYTGKLSYDLILERYEKYEQRRLGLLRLCRDERSRLIDEDRNVQRISLSQKRTGQVSDFLDSDSETENFDINSSEFMKRMAAKNSESGFQMIENTAKRNKTRRSLSSRDTANESPRSPRSPRPFSQLLSSSLDKNYADSTRLDNDFWRSFTEPRPYISKESAAQRHGWDENYMKPRSPSLSRSKSPSTQRRSVKMQRTLSVDNILADLPSHLQRGAAKLSDNDQRILNVMVSKANKEEVEKRLQAARKQELIEEQMIENERKQMQLKRHQMQLAERMKESHELRELHKRKLTEQREERRRLVESEIQTKNDYWLKEISKQLESKGNELLMKSMQREDRKRMQEENLARAMEEKEYLRNVTHTGLVDRHEHATKTKEMQVKVAKSKQAMRNLEEKERHEMKMEETKRRLREDQMALQYAIECKHRRAQMNNRYAEREKNFTVTSTKMQQQRKKEQQEESLRRIQYDIESWQKELHRYQAENEERATETAKKNSYLKGKKAMMDRLQKEHDNLMNKQKIKRDEKVRLAELESSVKGKDMKSKMILEEKQSATKASREAALASRTIRDLIKEKTVKSSFDKMASEAELMARIEKRGYHR